RRSYTTRNSKLPSIPEDKAEDPRSDSDEADHDNDHDQGDLRSDEAAEIAEAVMTMIRRGTDAVLPHLLGVYEKYFGTAFGLALVHKLMAPD
ncbi:unnamed protein product, partial [Amoebophrya sp. A25]